ncbi:hypothetical protein MTR67_018619 [Solanum verrucosum]|uniref:Uncharacterized protein n=1 Tax=Solanum verrucosum TaxID=315347 RepID=A0AAF0QSM6_SOLVR|nr:hypothetical protein MTR67_018619 [Solanum verrucosum]
MMGVMRFGKKGKLSPRYVVPYKISKRVASIVPLESVVVKDSLTYKESVEGVTWETEAAMKAKYPHLFPSDSIPA